MCRAAVSVVILLVLAAPTARAFELLRTNNDPCARETQNLFWRADGVAVNTSRLPEPLRGLAEEARARWNLSLTRFSFSQGGGAACTRDGVASLDLVKPPCGLDQFGDALAITRSFWNSAGELVDADVTFNPDSYIVEDQAAFLHVALHELGHVLGLAHSDACAAGGVGTLMKAVLSNRTFDAPQADDVSGAQAIYPGGGDGTVPEGANSCAIGPPAGVAGLQPLLLGAALLLALRRRRD